MSYAEVTASEAYNTTDTLQHEQLSRSKDKDGGKLAKKKDSSSGTASPHGGSSNQSPSATPTSSTSNLVEGRNKQLPGPDVPTQNHAGAPMPGPPTNSSMQQTSNAFSPPAMSGSSASNGASTGGPSTPARHNLPLAPSVVISPSAPVSAVSTRSVCMFVD